MLYKSEHFAKIFNSRVFLSAKKKQETQFFPNNSAFRTQDFEKK